MELDFFSNFTFGDEDTFSTETIFNKEFRINSLTKHPANLHDITNINDITHSSDIMEINDITHTSDITNLNDTTQMSDFMDLNGVTCTSDITDLNDITHTRNITNLNDLTQINDIRYLNEVTQMRDITDLTDVTHTSDIASLNDTTQISNITDQNDFASLEIEIPSNEIPSKIIALTNLGSPPDVCFAVKSSPLAKEDEQHKTIVPNDMTDLSNENLIQHQTPTHGVTENTVGSSPQSIGKIRIATNLFSGPNTAFSNEENVFSNEIEEASAIYESDSDILFCQECDTDFLKKSDLMDHMWMAHKQESHECAICNKVYITEQHLANHFSLSHNSQETFGRRRNLIIGDNANTPQSWQTRYNSCILCGKEYGQQKRLFIHMWEAHQKKCFKCDICPNLFSQRKNVMDHIRRVHKISKFNTTGKLFSLIGNNILGYSIDDRLI